MPRFRFPSLIVACLSLWCSPVLAAPPRDELLRLVPDDAGLCLFVQNLRQQLDRLHASPFAEKLAASPIGQLFRNAPELKHLAAFDQQLLTKLQITSAQLRDDILGDAIVVAYTPGPPDKPEQEQGLLLLHARNPGRLVALFDRLNDIQRQSGELIAVESRKFGSQPYVRRQKKDGEEYYAIRGPLLVFSDCEARLHKALECDRTRPPADREPPEQLRQLQGLAVEQNLF